MSFTITLIITLGGYIFRFLMYKTGNGRKNMPSAEGARHLARRSGVSASFPSRVWGSALEANVYFKYNCNFLGFKLLFSKVIYEHI